MPEGNGFVMRDSDGDIKGAKNALPKVDFSGFILSLYSSGLVQLGKVEDPITGKKNKDLLLARHSIDMMAMLEEKTRGNLSDEESNLLRSILSDMRMAFVAASSESN
jgi:hypothetical protein